MKNLLKITKVPGIYSEKASKNQDTFDGSLGLNRYQGTHKMSADVDRVIK